MNTKLLAGASVAALLLTSATAMAAEKSRGLTVSLTVNPIVLLFVTDNDMTMEASDITTDDLDATGASVADGRAQFWVVSNTAYDIALEVDTWTPAGSSDNHVKFVGTGPEPNHIGGSIFLDTDISTGTPDEDGADIVSWDYENGELTYNKDGRGVHRYGVGAVFNPQIWSGNGDEDHADAPSTDADGNPMNAASIAPVDTYTVPVTVRVTSDT